MVPDIPDAVLIAEILIAVKSRVAPKGSVREKILRGITRPLLRLLRRRRQARLVRDTAHYPVASVERWRGLAERAAALPDRPRILILKLDHIGDFIVGMPAIAHLRAGFPDASLALVCGSWNRPWAERSGWFDRVVAFDFFTKRNADWTGATQAQFDAFAALALGSFDLAIDLRHDADTRPLLARVDASFRAGFCAPVEKGGSQLDIALPDVEHVSPEAGTGQPLHADMRLMLLANLVTNTFRMAGPHPARVLVTGDTAAPIARPFAILAPGAGSPIRCWPVPHLTEIGRRLLDHKNLDLVLTGGPTEEQAAAEIAAALPADRVRNLCGHLPLADLPDLIRDCALYLGYDTGTTHLAASLGAPTVAILSGVPRIEVWYPMGQNVTVVVGRIACSPCYLVRAEQCPYGVPCLNAITVKHVWDACEETLARVALTPAPTPPTMAAV